jgi:SAM-dependent methyltransferase
MLKTDSLERLVPEFLDVTDATGRETYQLHIERYEFAAKQARSGRLLDIACGVGYGSRLIADERSDISEVYGADVSIDAISYAQKHYAGNRVQFGIHDAMNFSSDALFDTIVSLETIEHLPQPMLFMQRITQSLHPGGLFIGSVPTTPSVDANPHHLHDFSERSFRDMGRRCGLQEVACCSQVQPFNPFQIVSGRETRLSDMRQNLLGYYMRNPYAAIKRAWSTVADGFNNKYLTVAWKK